MSDEEFFDRMADDMEARAKADSLLGRVRVIERKKGDIVAQIDEALGVLTSVGGKYGACIVLLPPEDDGDVLENAPGSPSRTRFTWLVLVSTLLNMDATKGTQVSPRQIIARLRKVFGLFTSGGIAHTMVARPFKEAVDQNADEAFEVPFVCDNAIEQDFNKVITPRLSSDEGAAPQSVTITCATPGAAIYYTLDGSYPSPATGTLYAGAIAIDAACVLRATGTLTDYIDSDVAAGIYT